MVSSQKLVNFHWNENKKISNVSKIIIQITQITLTNSFVWSMNLNSKEWIKSENTTESEGESELLLNLWVLISQCGNVRTWKNHIISRTFIFPPAHDTVEIKTNFPLHKLCLSVTSLYFILTLFNRFTTVSYSLANHRGKVQELFAKFCQLLPRFQNRC